mmetsp:Transcript_15267/g.24811  ORF Transcript_15267/g.24811 Transcript_15267/m.24811 type:complete len:413 (+) Transcript_15267:129-1367(+)
MGKHDQDADEDGVQGLALWVDQLTEKRKTTREGGLGSVLSYLQRNVVREDAEFQAELDQQFETLWSHLKGMLKKAKEQEFSKACNTMEALALNVSPEEGVMMFNEALVTLHPYVQVSAKPEQIESSIRALSSLCFLWNDEDDETIKVLEIASSLVKDYVPDDTKIAAIRAWGILASTVDDGYVNEHFDEMVALFLPLLKHECMDIRVEAGENLAFLLSAKGVAGDSSEAEETVHEVAEQGIIVENPNAFVLGAQKMEADNSKRHSNDEEDDLWLDDLVEALENLSHDKCKQKHKVGSILSSVRDGESPSEKIVCEKVNIPLDNWVDVKRLALLKDILQDGFTEHFKGNGMLHAIFDVHNRGLDAHIFGNRLGGMDGRVYYSSHSTASKNATVSRNKARNKREAAKSNFLQGE